MSYMYTDMLKNIAQVNCRKVCIVRDTEGTCTIGTHDIYICMYIHVMYYVYILYSKYM